MNGLYHFNEILTFKSLEIIGNGWRFTEVEVMHIIVRFTIFSYISLNAYRYFIVLVGNVAISSFNVLGVGHRFIVILSYCIQCRPMFTDDMYGRYVALLSGVGKIQW